MAKDDRNEGEQPLEPSDVDELLKAVGEAGWDEARIIADGITMVYSRSSSQPSLAPSEPPAQVPAEAPASLPESTASPTATAAPEPTAATPPPEAESPEAEQPEAAVDGHVVKSPSLGLFWRSPQPGAPPFVEVGDEVDADTTVCIIEVMKLMNHVKAGVGGRVVQILQEDSDMVEFDAPLVTIAPE